MNIGDRIERNFRLDLTCFDHMLARKEVQVRMRLEGGHLDDDGGGRSKRINLNIGLVQNSHYAQPDETGETVQTTIVFSDQPAPRH